MRQSPIPQDIVDVPTCISSPVGPARNVFATVLHAEMLKVCLARALKSWSSLFPQQKILHADTPHEVDRSRLL